MLKIQWIDGKRKAKCAPDPNFPTGIDLDLSDGKLETCQRKLPYPAKGIGQYVVTCSKCLLKVVATTAGRQDDPRSIKISCREEKVTG